MGIYSSTYYLHEGCRAPGLLTESIGRCSPRRRVDIGRRLSVGHLRLLGRRHRLTVLGNGHLRRHLHGHHLRGRRPRWLGGVRRDVLVGKDAGYPRGRAVVRHQDHSLRRNCLSLHHLALHWLAECWLTRHRLVWHRLSGHRLHLRRGHWHCVAWQRLPGWH